MAVETEEERRYEMDQILSSAALEGAQPSRGMRELAERYIRGDIGRPDFDRLACEYINSDFPSGHVTDRPPAPLATSILFVDDEAMSRKWFAIQYGDEFSIVTANSTEHALALLAERGHQFAVIVTDYRMPEGDGLKLLAALRAEQRHLVRVLVTAYADKDLAIAAVNKGKVLHILEKPLDDSATRAALREALELYRTQAMERHAS